MSQTTKSAEIFNQGINIIIAVVVAGIAVLGSLITKLENEASTEANRASIAEQQFYYQAIGKQISGKADVNYAFGTVYQLWYQYEVQRSSSEKRGEEDSIRTYTELRDAVAKTSPLFGPQYFDANTGRVNLALYEADVYQRELYELEEKQFAANEVASAWYDKSSTYVLQLTLLAVAGFLLGLAVITKPRIPTLIFAISGILMVVLISGWAYQVSQIPVIERSEDAFIAFAEGASLRDQKRWDESLEKLNQAIEKAGPENSYGRAFLLRAQVHTEKGNFTEAIADYRVAIDSGFTEDPTVDARLVQAYFHIGDFDNAIRAGNTAIKTSPENLMLRQQVNMAILANGDAKTATEQVSILLQQATEKVNIQRQLGDNTSAAETWWLLNEAAHQYEQLVELLANDKTSSPVKKNITDPIKVGKNAQELAMQLRAGAIALKYNLPEPTASGTSASPAKIDIKQIIPSVTPDDKYVHKVEMEFSYSGLEAGQVLSIVTYRNGIEEPSWTFSGAWTNQQTKGTARHTLSPSYSSLFIVPPGFYTVSVYLNGNPLAQGEFTVDDPNAQVVNITEDQFVFGDMLDQFDLYTSDYIYGYSYTDDSDYYDWYYYFFDPFFFYDKENSYWYFLEGSYDYYSGYCTDLNDLDCYTSDDQDGDGIPDEYDYCAFEPGPIDFNGCPIFTEDADGDGIKDESDDCPYAAGLEEDYGCPVEDPEVDFDGDGTSDSYDVCPYEPGSIEYEGCPISTDDADGDGISDESDNCPYASGPEEGNGCPVENPETDFDGDGTPDSYDGCPDEPGSIEYDGCPFSTDDADGDGVSDESDLCPYASGPEENNGCPPVDDTDSDGDGTSDSYDACPDEPGSIEYGGCPVSTDDTDGDGISDESDDCPYEPGLEEDNGCPIVDTEFDSDGDGISDAKDECPFESGPADNGGCPNVEYDADSDGDGISDSYDECPYESGPADNGGCPVVESDPDSDGDGISDSYDSCPYKSGPDWNGGCPVEDPDSDGDGIPDSADGCPYDPGPEDNGGCPIEESDPDSDGDGIPDSADGCPYDPGPEENGGCP